MHSVRIWKFKSLLIDIDAIIPFMIKTKSYSLHSNTSVLLLLINRRNMIKRTLLKVRGHAVHTHKIYNIKHVYRLS